MSDGSALHRRLNPLKARKRPGWIGLIGLVGLAIAAALVLVGATKLAIATVFGVAGLAMLVYPNVAIYAFAFLLFTNAPVVASRFHGVPSIVVAGVAGLLLIPLIHQLVIQRKPLIFAPALPLIGLFAAFRVLAITWAGEKDLAIDSVVATIGEGLILFFLVTNVIRSRETLRGVVFTMLLAGSLLGVLSVVQQTTGNFDNDFGGFAQTSLDKKIIQIDTPAKDARSAGPIGEKNYYAQFMLLLVPLALVWVKTEKRRWRWCVSLIVTLVIMLGVASTASRGAAIGFAAMVVAMIGLREVQFRHIALIVACAVSVVILVPTYQQRLNSMIQAAGVLPAGASVQAIEKSLQGRISEMWAAALLFAEHPIHGVGPGNFPPEFLKKAGSLGFQVHAEQRMAHCSYLEIAAETGLIGLLLYLSILGVTLRELWFARERAANTIERNQATGFLLVVIVMMTTGLFLSFAFERYYWFALALAAVAAMTVRQSSEGSAAHDSVTTGIARLPNATGMGDSKGEVAS